MAKLIESVLQGINVTVFAYGQTASGKTHTIRGTESAPGLIPLTIHRLFSEVSQHHDRRFAIKVSFMELYNEMVNDLLEETNTNLEVKESWAGVYVKGLTVKPVASVAESLECLAAGDAIKKVGETLLNKQSSRSHTVFRLTIDSTLATESADTQPLTAQLNLVDLAGSEGLSRTRAEGLRLRYRQE